MALVLLGTGRIGPVIVTIEDIHWADPALLDLLEDLADRARGRCCSCVRRGPSSRPIAPIGAAGGGTFRASPLEPLSAKIRGSSSRCSWTVDELPNDVRAQILERADGNPFFLEEIVRRSVG